MRKNIRAALEEAGIEADVNFRRVDDDEAAGLKLKGSPSVFIDGHELQPIELSGFF